MSEQTQTKQHTRQTISDNMAISHLKKYWSLYRQLRSHRHLAEKRDPNFSRNRAAKIIGYFSVAVMIVYMMLLAVLMSLTVNDSSRTSSVSALFGFMPFVLIMDFIVRLMVQQTPAQIVKPYSLLPIPMQACVDNFIVSSMLSYANLIWYAFFLPYTIMSVLFSYGLAVSISLTLVIWLIILISNQFYSISRTLISFSMAWWLMPLAVFTAILSPLYVGEHSGVRQLVRTYSSIVGERVAAGSVVPLLIALLSLAALVMINRKVQMRGARRELMKTNQTKIRKVSNFSVLEKYGAIGLYLQIEIKSIMRNSIVKKTFLYAFAISLLLILVVSFTDIYDHEIYIAFWGIYIFVVFGAMLLSKMMGYEGNYIECLLVHKENILALLKAKYLFFCGMTLVFYVFTIPSVLAGKWTFLALTSYALFTCGAQYFLLFQIGVYNKQTVKLNSKLIGKGGVENNYFSMTINIVCITVPAFFVITAENIVGKTAAYIMMSIIGIAFIATSKFWLRNIYNRMMKRMYVNLEGFRATR